MRAVLSLCVICIAAIGCGSSSPDKKELIGKVASLQEELARTQEQLKSAQAQLADKEKVGAPAASARGIGVSRDQIAEKLREKFAAKFTEQTPVGSQKQRFAANIDGVHVVLWGAAENLDAITIIGSFEGEYGTRTTRVLATALDTVTPKWGAEERGRWFMKAASRSDDETAVSTLQGDIDITLVSAQIDRNVVRTISFKRYGQ